MQLLKQSPPEISRTNINIRQAVSVGRLSNGLSKCFHHCLGSGKVQFPMYYRYAVSDFSSSAERAALTPGLLS